jgi:hypothetical protein
VPALNDPCNRAARERRIQAGLRDRRLGTALGGYALRLPVGGISWGKELARVPPENAVRLLMRRWGPDGWACCYQFEGDGTLVWHGRLRGEMAPGDYLTAADPVELHEQIDLYPVRRVTVPL